MSSAASNDGRGSRHSFRDLLVWQKAQHLTVAVLALVKTLSTDRATSVLVQQLVRSASSVGANIAEGHGRFVAGAYRNHLSIARGSACETLSWLDVMRRSKLISEQAEQELAEVCDEILRMISAQMIQLDRQTGRAGGFRDEREPYVTD